MTGTKTGSRTGLCSRRPGMGVRANQFRFRPERTRRQPQIHAESLKLAPVAVFQRVNSPASRLKAAAALGASAPRSATRTTIPRLLIFAKQLSRKMDFRKPAARSSGAPGTRQASSPSAMPAAPGLNVRAVGPQTGGGARSRATSERVAPNSLGRFGEGFRSFAS